MTAIPDFHDDIATFCRRTGIALTKRQTEMLHARFLAAHGQGCVDESPVAEARGVQRAIDWHKKNGRICREIANDDPHFNEDDRRRARQAGAQHDASAAGLEKMLIDEHAAAIRKLMEGGGE